MRLNIAQLAIASLVLYSISRLFLAGSDMLMLRVLLGVVGFIALLAMPSILLAKFLAIASKQSFTRLELLNMSVPIGLLVLPGLLLLGSNAIRQLSPLLLVSNAIISLLLLASFPAGRDFIFRQRQLWPLPSRQAQPTPRLWVSSPLFWVVLFYLLLVTHMTTLYRALPDLDPYTWLIQFDKFILNENYPSSLDYRPLFHYLIYYLVESLQVPVFVVFKYIFPYLAVLTILPAWLVAHKYNNVWSRILILTIPLMVPSTVLYLQLPIPQAVVAILAYYFTFWLVYAWKRNSLFYYLAGGIAFLGFLHHESIVFLALSWLVITALFDFRQIISFFKHNTLTAVLLVILFLSNTRYFSQFVLFIYGWAATVKEMVRYYPNWEFPARYINIDQLNVGWPGIAGVTKYYLFYAGPVVISITLLALLLLITSTSYRKKLWSRLRNHKAFAVLILTFLLLLLLTEVMPRVMSVALLPDRLWIFLGAASSVFLFTLLDRRQGKHKMFIAGILLLAVVSMSGAVYINYLKQYLIPDYQVTAARWIRENLPANRAILTDYHANLIMYFAQSPIIAMPDAFFCNPNVIDDATIQKDEVLRDRLLTHNILEPVSTLPANHFAVALRTFLSENSSIQLSELQRFITAYSAPRANTTFNYELNEHAHAYIFYSPAHPRHPYAARNYTNTSQKKSCPTPVFDDYPDRFKKVYEDGDRVIIWQWQ